MRHLTLPTLLAAGALVLGSAAVITVGAADATTGAPAAAPATHSVIRARAAVAAHLHAPAYSAAQAARLTAAATAAVAHPTSAVANLSPSLQAQAATAGSTIDVVVDGADTNSLVGAVQAEGGQVRAAITGQVSASVPTRNLRALARRAGVASVQQPERAVADAISEGVADSNAGPSTTAGTWQAAGQNGSGVTVGVIDLGFANLSEDANLPQTLDYTESSSCISTTDHGSAVAEIINEMAPQATLKLACVSDATGLAAAVAKFETEGVTIINTSLSFPGDGEGNASALPGSAEATVAAARKAGILWVASAGNSANDHWSGTFADPDKDGVADLTYAPSTDYNYDAFELAGTNDLDGAAGTAQIDLTWNQWPYSTANITLFAFGVTCTDEACDGTTNPQQIPVSQPTAANSHATPSLEVDLTNTNQNPQLWYVEIVTGKGQAFPKVHYDLTYDGDISTSLLSDEFPAQAAASSIAEPASSPYVLAVGAVDVAADSNGGACFSDSSTTIDGYPLEAYSSQGPTIDGRVKPDIAAYDGVSGAIYGANGFCGTSASSPTVAGAAALVKGANSALDASQIQNLLEQRASNGSPNTPPNNQTGHGLLTLGAPSGVTGPVGSLYQPLSSPVRIADTRYNLGSIFGHTGGVGAAGLLTVKVPNLPADATAVAINLTGTGAHVATSISAYPAGTAYANTSNLNLDPADSTAAVFAVVTLGHCSDDNTLACITIRNSLGGLNVVVDELGYFGTGAETGSYVALAAPVRALDTRYGTGGVPAARIPNNGTVEVAPTNEPTGAIAAVVNLTVTDDSTTVGNINASPDCSTASSTLNYAYFTRANLTIVHLDNSGQFCVLNRGGSVDVIADVVGYLVNTGSGSEYHALPSPTRIIDTRYGLGSRTDLTSSLAFPANTAATYWGSGIGDVPFQSSGTSALLVGIVDASASAASYASLYPGTTRPSTSTVNWTPNRPVPNAAIVGLSSNQFSVYNSAGTANFAVDLFGYFSS